MFKKFKKNLVVACKVTLLIQTFIIPIVICMNFINDIIILLAFMIVWGTVFGAFVYTIFDEYFYK